MGGNASVDLANIALLRYEWTAILPQEITLKRYIDDGLALCRLKETQAVISLAKLCRCIYPPHLTFTIEQSNMFLPFLDLYIGVVNNRILSEPFSIYTPVQTILKLLSSLGSRLKAFDYKSTVIPKVYSKAVGKASSNS